MIGENTWQHPTVHNTRRDPMATISSPFSSDNLNGVNESRHSPSLYRHLPSNDSESSCGDEFLCDKFRIYEFKVRRCCIIRSHDWTKCPYAHPGEKARRRDPMKYHYSGTACPEFRKGNCRRGDSCEHAHGVFECWLHPDRYRTMPCKDGNSCLRKICFFAHTPDQLRVLPESNPRFSSILKRNLSKSAPLESPVSKELTDLMRKLQLNRGYWNSGYGGYYNSSSCSTQERLRNFEDSENASVVVESGKELRAKMYARLSKENSLC